MGRLSRHLYSGDSLIKLNQSVQKTDQASQAFNSAQTVFVQDVNLFTQFAIASNRKADEGIAAYIQTELMRPTLRKQVEWWSETDGGRHPVREAGPVLHAAQ